MIKSNGGIIGPDNVTTGGAFGSASGVFKLGEVTDLIKESKWPTAGPQGYQSANSCRFNSGSSDYLNRTPSSASNRRTFTFSFWVKRTKLSANQTIYNVRPGSPGKFIFSFHSGDTFRIAVEPISKFVFTNRLFRDVSAWYHIVVAIDTTQGTASNRIKLYVNGVQETSFSQASYPDQNADLDVNTTTAINIGRDLENSSNFIGMYLSEFVFIDGQQLAPTSFGEFNSQTGIWVPKVVTGLTFGTNGFYLPFTNSGALGEDFSGEDNDFTVNNLTSLDQSTDTCSTNFATLNPLDDYYFNGTFSDGNLSAVSNVSGYSFCTSTMGVSSGKWYVETKSTTSNNLLVGVTGNTATANTQGIGNAAGQASYGNAGALRLNGAYTSSWGSSYTSGDIVGVALDLDNNKIYFSKNGTWQDSANPSAGSGGETVSAASTTVTGNYFFGVSDNNSGTSSTFSYNFGSPPYAISSGNTDGNGFGNFEYAPPSGFLSLNTKNLAAVLA